MGRTIPKAMAITAFAENCRGPDAEDSISEVIGSVLAGA
jgi:hypothetical protein